MNTQAFFLPSDGAAGGQRFCLYHPAQGAAARSAIVYVHPFAEEMNKSRRMAALQSRAFAQAGHAVLQIDLLGCGDSSGDFGDASWSAWIDDVLLACRWLQAHVDAPLCLWGLRAGALLAAEAARRLQMASQLLFWQPAVMGRQVLQQFLRLKLAGDMLSGQARGAMETLRCALASGQTVEIAGYRLAPALADGLDRAGLHPHAGVSSLTWIELSPRDDAELPPASRNALARWQEAGCATSSWTVRGPSFWQTTEIEDAPALIDATLASTQAAAFA